MKKRIAFRKLNRTPAHKWSMLRNQVSSLIEHERIVTTEAKAKELRHLADHVITLAKRGLKEPSSPLELHNRRRAAAIVRGDWNVSKLFDVLGPRYKFRDGGYTRVMKIARPRAGDNAPMAVIEYVDRPGEIRAARPPATLRQTAIVDGLEEALRGMGIPSVDDLLTPEEQEELEKELRKNEE
mmetsp:Transcript_5087/g.9013  ORF Transcript_5087/g.9013 Transcript_5087/m.9013 type:complete len:183 (-) Transcript_5087:133-681(-)